MRTTVTLDDALLTKAAELSGTSERTALLRAGLMALIERESVHRPALEPPRRTAGQSWRGRTLRRAAEDLGVASPYA